MTFNEAKDVFLNRGYVEVESGQIFDGDKWRQCIVVISEWLKQDPCKDCISRKDAIIQLSHNKTGDDDCDVIVQSDIETIKALPPVTPKQKTGHWKRISIDKYVQHAMAYYKCSVCDKDIIGKHNYCPNCGAKMEEVKE